MASEARKAPVQFGATLRRILCGRAGWSGLVLQIVFAALIVWLGYEIFANVTTNLHNQRIASGFGFFSQTAGFGVSQSLIPYSESDSYARVFFVGLVNTLVVAAVGIGRLSRNWLVARISGGYVELIRNLPLLFQILFWYLAVLGALPGPRQSISLFDEIFISNRGLVIPRPIPHDGLMAFLVAIAVAVVAALALRGFARRRLFREGRPMTIGPYVLALLIGLPLFVVLVFGTPFSIEVPQLKGFNFAGGLRVVPEFVALTLALSTYTAAFIAENVRAGIQSVSRGQMEAGESLGLSHGATLRLIVVPQAMRVILPPLTNQYLNLTKNSSLAVAIGYPDLFSVFAGTTLSQTGQAIEIIAITMGVYLLISILTSVLMGLYGRRVNRSLSR
jgi:general L-amino acid transport system permease protein